MDRLTLNSIACQLAKRMKKGRWGMLPDDKAERILGRAEKLVKEWGRRKGTIIVKAPRDAEDA